MKNSFNLFLSLFLFITCTSIVAQPWLQAPYLKQSAISENQKSLNFYEIQRAFREYEEDYERYAENNKRKGAEVEEEGKFPGYAQFKRWEWRMESRVYPSGNLSLPSTNNQEFQKYLNSESNKKIGLQTSNSTGNWLPLGPSGTVWHDDWGGAARVNFLRFDPVNSNIMWTASPLGGLWKTIDGGLNWTTNTDQLSIIGCSDVAINPSNTQIMYLATGDANGTSSQLTLSSIGILKSIDGGVTWGSNTMNWQVGWNRGIYKLLINPLHPDTVFAATSVGVYRTVNAGSTWVQVQTGAFTDIEFKPGNPNVVYAVSGLSAGSLFYKSTDAGLTFVPVSSGLPLSSAVYRMEIGVTPADTNFVYIVAVKNSTYDFNGFYRSIDGGTTFTLRSNTPNILTGPAGAQAWYNLAMAVSPLHKDTVIVGGTNMWRTLDGGLTWTQHSKEVAGLIPFVHPDHHSIAFLPGNDSVYFSGNDGGIWKTSNRGVTWTTVNGGLQISQMYKLGTSPLDPYTILTGHQDMATHLLHANNWNVFTPNTGDGMECIYEHDNDTIMYLESYLGRIIVTYNTYPLYNIVCSTTGSGVNAQGNWITPVVMNPVYDTVLLVGKAQVWRTVNGGTSFSQVGSIPSTGGNMVALAYGPSNTNFIYAAKSTKFFISTDGTNFTDRTTGLPVSSAAITALAVSNTNPAKVWVTFSGYSSSDKVWVSSDTGVTWTNYSSGLPNLPVNCIVYQNNSANAIYVGTDVGVYFRNDTLPSWQSYFTGLPNVDVEELEIAYGINKLRAATNGRGLWETSLPTNLSVSIQSTTLSVCIGGSSQLSTTLSGNSGGTYSYSWLPVAGLSNTGISNPVATPAVSTTYTVTVTETATGQTVTAAISVTMNPLPTPAISPSGPVTFCKGDSVTLDAGNGYASYVWSTGSSLQGITVKLSGTYTVTVTSLAGCQGSSLPQVVSVKPLPSSTLSTTGPLTTCSGLNALTLTANSGNNFTYQWLKNGTLISGASGQTYIPSVSGTYKVVVINSNGCRKTSSGVVVTVKSLPSANITAQGPLNFCAGDSVILSANPGTGFTYQWLKNNVAIPLATLHNYTATSAGAYKVIVTNLNGCTKTSAGKQVKINCRLNNDTVENTEMVVFPNPNNGGFTVHLESMFAEKGIISVYNVLGQKVYSETILLKEGTNSFSVELENKTAGIYTLYLRSAHVGNVKKFSIE